MIAQHYREGGDSENNFDELKNQWGWAGFTTHDRKRCQVMARIVALIDNWWTIFMRLGIPEKHAEAISSRPLALHGLGTETGPAFPGLSSYQVDGNPWSLLVSDPNWPSSATL